MLLRVVRAVLVGITAVVVMEVVFLDPLGGPTRTASARRPGPRAPTNPEPVSVAMLSEKILARPLFTPGRRAEQAEAPEAPAPKQEADPEVRLKGVVTLAKLRWAVVELEGSPKSIVAARGDHVGRWTVRDISQHDVTLSGREGTRILKPAPPGGQSAPPSEMPAAAMAPGPGEDDRASANQDGSGGE